MNQVSVPTINTPLSSAAHPASVRPARIAPTHANPALNTHNAAVPTIRPNLPEAVKNNLNDMLIKDGLVDPIDGSLVIGTTAGAMLSAKDILNWLLGKKPEPQIRILGDTQPISITEGDLKKETIVKILENYLGLNSDALSTLSEEELKLFLEISLQEITEREEIINAIMDKIINNKLHNGSEINLLGQEHIQVQQGPECTVEAAMNLQKAAQNTNAVNITLFSREDVKSVLPQSGHGRNFSDLPKFFINHGYNINQAFKWEEVIDSLIDETGILYTQINGNHAVVVCGLKIQDNKAYFLVADSMNPEIRAIEINHFLQIMSAPRIVNNPHVPQNYRTTAFLATWTTKKEEDQIIIM